MHCDALQGQFFEHEIAFDQAPLFQVQATVPGALAEVLSEEEDRHW